MKSLFNCILCLVAITSFGQANLVIPANIILPKDSLVKMKLINSLNGFLGQKEKANKENTYVLREDLLETSALIDEIKGIELNENLRDSTFYKPYLSNVVKLTDTTCLVQFAYMGIAGNMSDLRACFTVIAKQSAERFYFSSPLKAQVGSWKKQQLGSYVFHYKNDNDIAGAKDFAKKAVAFDNKLHVKGSPVEFYCCDNLSEVLQILGVTYKSDYNSYNYNTFTANENGYNLVVNSTPVNRFDLHDLWHERLHNVIPVNIINKPVDEGCAYLYGGSWGLSWQVILKKFKEKVASDPKADWLALYESFYNFGEGQQQHLVAGYVMNALIVEKLQKEKGFFAVMELLKCGKYEKGNENYFKALEKLTGINRENFNEEVQALINAS